MIYAILAIFAVMTNAEQQTIINSACSVPDLMPVETHRDARFGTIRIYPDGSSTQITNYSTLVRSSENIELYFAESD